MLQRFYTLPLSLSSVVKADASLVLRVQRNRWLTVMQRQHFQLVLLVIHTSLNPCLVWATIVAEPLCAALTGTINPRLYRPAVHYRILCSGVVSIEISKDQLDIPPSTFHRFL
jgi:hypothetical protein